MSRIGDRVREVRRHFKLTQPAMAKRSKGKKLTGNYLSKLESGEALNPEYEKLEAIAAALGVDMSVITAPKGAPIPKAGYAHLHYASSTSTPEGPHAAVVPTADAAAIDTLRRLVHDLAGALDRAAIELTEASERAAGAGAEAPGGDSRATGTRE